MTSGIYVLEVACAILSKEIKAGNVETAKEIAETLAELQANLMVQILAIGPFDPSHDFKIHIHVEDRNDSKALCTLSVNPQTTTVRMLKYMVCMVQ